MTGYHAGAASWRTVVPQHMQERPQWVAWGPDPEDGKPKCPLIIGDTGCRASSTNPRTWRSFAAAARHYEAHAGPNAGVAYVFTADEGLVFIDGDDCLDEAGALKGWARPFLGPFLGRTYVERSPSGTGLHVFVRGGVPASTGRKFAVADGAVEIYTSARYSTVTGDIYACSDLLDEAQDAIDALIAALEGPPKLERRPDRARRTVVSLDAHRDYRVAGDALRWLDPDLPLRGLAHRAAGAARPVAGFGKPGIRPVGRLVRARGEVPGIGGARDENSSDARIPLDRLGRISEATGVTPVVIHHARKPTQNAQGGARMSVRGSGALYDACGSVLVFQGEKNGPTTVSHEKARISGRPHEDFRLWIEDVEIDDDPKAGLRVTLLDAPPHSEKNAAPDRVAELMDRIVALARSEGSIPASIEGLRARLKARKGDVAAAVSEIKRGRLLTPGGTSREPTLTYTGTDDDSE